MNTCSAGDTLTRADGYYGLEKEIVSTSRKHIKAAKAKEQVLSYMAIQESKQKNSYSGLDCLICFFCNPSIARYCQGFSWSGKKKHEQNCKRENILYRNHRLGQVCWLTLPKTNSLPLKVMAFRKVHLPFSGAFPVHFGEAFQLTLFVRKAFQLPRDASDSSEVVASIWQCQEDGAWKKSMKIDVPLED